MNAIEKEKRQKLLNVMAYFSENVTMLGKTKLFKLLSYLDFLHYEQTGRSVTGLTYYAWPMGPVPKTLYEEMESPKNDFNRAVVKREEKVGQLKREAFRKHPSYKIDESIFSPLELQLLQNLSKKYFRHTAEEMVDATHEVTGVWHQIWNVEERRQAEMPYEYMLLRRNSDTDKQIMEHAQELKEFEQALQ